jgi:hypothetical protein
MPPATQAIDTPSREGQYTVHPVAAAVVIFTGAIVALDASGNAVPAADTAGLRVIGRAEQDVDNSAGLAGAKTVTIKRGCFAWANSETEPVAQANVGKPCFVEDDNTVASDSTNRVIAGRVLGLESGSVWVETSHNDIPHLPALTSTDGTAGTAADLGELKAEVEKIGDDLRALHAAVTV